MPTASRRWLVAPLVLVAGLMLMIPSRGTVAGSHDLEGEHEALVHRGSITCGVERWFVKTGMDADAKKVNVKAVVPTNIMKLRSLPAPADLPSRSRIVPTERTVFKVTGFLLRFKKEDDSDYHLVLSDSSGRTMIAEIPAPDCVGKTSPFLPQMRAVRRQFDRRYHATSSWRRFKVPVSVTGVGFFDFEHGQSGVAPNAIELHPVLSITFGKTASGGRVNLPPPPRPVSGKFALTAWVSPARMSDNAYPTLYAKTVPGASCSASVVYSTGRAPRSFNGVTRTVGSSGRAMWPWHEMTMGSGGTATVTCSYRGQTKYATARFTVT